MIPVQFITHQNERFGYVDGARMALQGGCKWIQLRMKGASDDEVRAAAKAIQPLCKEQEAVFLIDDRVALAKELKADGVHLGKNDMPVSEARRVLGEDFIIGGTANTYDDIERLYREGADYIGCGPFRFTTTKQNLAPVLGLEGAAYALKTFPTSCAPGCAALPSPARCSALPTPWPKCAGWWENSPIITTKRIKYGQQHQDYLPEFGKGLHERKALPGTQSGHAQGAADPYRRHS